MAHYNNNNEKSGANLAMKKLKKTNKKNIKPLRQIVSASQKAVLKISCAPPDEKSLKV